jgi:hypothetical protein
MVFPIFIRLFVKKILNKVSACFYEIVLPSVEAEFLDEIQTKVFRVFLLAIHSHLYSFALEISISSNSRNLLRIFSNSRNLLGISIIQIENHTPSLWFKKSIQNFQGDAQKPQRNCMTKNSASRSMFRLSDSRLCL